MADENQEVVQDQVEQDAPQLSEIEQDAYKEGWRPEAEFGGDKSKWIPADEFMRRKPLFSKIDELKSENYHTRKELQEVKKTLGQLATHHKQVREVEYQRALKELQVARRDAMEDRDHDAVIALEDKIDQVKEQKKEFEQELKQDQQAQAQPTPEYVEWIKSNEWYLQDQEMHGDADGFALSFIQKKPQATPSEVYAHVSQRIKKAYPEKFGGTQPVSSTPKQPSPVDSGRQSATPVKKEKFTLTQMEEDICRNLVKNNVMTRDEYIAELKKVSE
jgi:hypothetical protein